MVPPFYMNMYTRAATITTTQRGIQNKTARKKERKERKKKKKKMYERKKTNPTCARGAVPKTKLMFAGTIICSADGPT